MEIIEYKIEGKILTVGFKESNFVVYSIIHYLETENKEQLLQRAYINAKSTIDYEKTLDKHSMTTDKIGEIFIPEPSKATRLDVDFNNLKGKVLDQYGEIISVDVDFDIQGVEKAKIQDGLIIEEEVAEDTEYYIVAKYGVLEKKQKRIIKVKEPTKAEILEEEINNLKRDRTISMKAMIELHTKIMKLEGDM